MSLPLPKRLRSNSPHATLRKPGFLGLTKAHDMQLQRPHTPDEPVTPPWHPFSLTYDNDLGPSKIFGRKMLRNDSFSSVGSLMSEDGGDNVEDDDWTPAEEEILIQAYERCADHSKLMGTPFQGYLPLQTTHAIARALMSQNKGWKHSLKVTRAKIQVLAKSRFERGKTRSDPDETPKRSVGRLSPLRQGSPELQAPKKDFGIISKLGSRLHGESSIFRDRQSHYHPYAPSNPSRITRTHSMSNAPITHPPSSPTRAHSASDEVMATPKGISHLSVHRLYPTPTSSRKYTKFFSDDVKSPPASKHSKKSSENLKNAPRPMPLGRFGSEVGTSNSIMPRRNQSAIYLPNEGQSPLSTVCATLESNPFFPQLNSPISSTSTLCNISSRGSVGSVTTLNMSEDDVEMMGDPEDSLKGQGLAEPFGGW